MSEEDLRCCHQHFSLQSRSASSTTAAAAAVPGTAAASAASATALKVWKACSIWVAWTRAGKRNLCFLERAHETSECVWLVIGCSLFFSFSFCSFKTLDRPRPFIHLIGFHIHHGHFVCVYVWLCTAYHFFPKFEPGFLPSVHFFVLSCLLLCRLLMSQERPFFSTHNWSRWQNKTRQNVAESKAESFQVQQPTEPDWWIQQPNLAFNILRHTWNFALVFFNLNIYCLLYNLVHMLIIAVKLLKFWVQF